MKLTIAGKLALGFGTVLILLVSALVFAVAGLGRARTAAEEMIASQEVMEATARLEIHALAAMVGLNGYVRTGAEEDAVRLKEARHGIKEMLAVVKTHHAEKHPEAVQAVEQAHKTFNGYVDSALAVADDDREIGRVALYQVSDYFDETFEPAIDELREAEAAHVEEIAASVRRQSATALTVAVVITVIALIIAAGTAFIVSQGITRSAAHLSAAAESISRGDLDVPIEVTTGDEMQTLAESIERMRASLKAAIERLQRRR